MNRHLIQTTSHVSFKLITKWKKRLRHICLPSRWISFFILILSVCCLATPQSHAEIAVVVNKENPTEQLSKRQVTNIFMGNYMAFPNGALAIPIDRTTSSKIRENFYRLLTGKSVSQINALWAKKIFSGRATPPQIIGHEKPIHELLSRNLNAIAYIDLNEVSADDKVVFILQ